MAMGFAVQHAPPQARGSLLVEHSVQALLMYLSRRLQPAGTLESSVEQGRSGQLMQSI